MQKSYKDFDDIRAEKEILKVGVQFSYAAEYDNDKAGAPRV